MNRLIVALDRRRGLAKNGGMPWYIPEDEQYFTDQTKSLGGNVLSGGVTFRVAYKSQPLAGRQNFILTHDTTPIPGVTLVHDLDKFLDEYKDQDVWVAGGAAVFEQIMAADKADELYITEIDADFGCGQFFPDYSGYELIKKSERREQNGFYFTYNIYAKR